MLIVLLRHGETAYNAQRRYQGKSDIPLSARGRARLRAADFAPDVAFVTALCRTAQTAAAVFPGARQAVEADLREMDFGDFEGKTYGELKDDPAYRAWLASGGEAACPNGEGKAAFCARVCRAFERLVDEALARASGLLRLERAACGRLRAGCGAVAGAAGAARGENGLLYGGKGMNILYAMLGGFALDWIFGDPAWLTHPVVIMGRAIAALESGLRKRLPKTPRGERLAGLTMAIVLPVGTLLLTGGVCRALAAVHPALGFAAELLWCAQALAATGLAQESTNVYRQLQKDDLPAARQAVGRIVGRDTEALTREGVIRAAVETVAENASDGVIAPLFYMMLGGAPLALTYKAVNTMDSMVGYKNERYLHFGRAAAKLDDAANYLPSRIAALLWVAAAALTGNDAKGAWRIWRRDRRNHASPNSAQTESACAGALGVQLAGPATYFGQYYDKPTIGDATRPIEPEDILRANRMMRVAGVLGLVAAAGIRWILG